MTTQIISGRVSLTAVGIAYACTTKTKWRRNSFLSLPWAMCWEFTCVFARHVLSRAVVVLILPANLTVRVDSVSHVQGRVQCTCAVKFPFNGVTITTYLEKGCRKARPVRCVYGSYQTGTQTQRRTRFSISSEILLFIHEQGDYPQS